MLNKHGLITYKYWEYKCYENTLNSRMLFKRFVDFTTKRNIKRNVKVIKLP